MARRHVFARRKFPSLVVPARTGTFSLDFHAEQQPNPESRVQLCDRRDSLGMRQLHIDWRQTALDVHTVTASLNAIGEEVAHSGCGELIVPPGAIEDALERDGPVGGHNIGTARMGTSRLKGVVDPDCRVHDLRNLFLAGSAVFPTSGQANPTLTIVALALRLAERLKRHFAPQAVGHVPTSAVEI
jgi:choline dehydrogenase-like flavoprotein